MNGKTVVGLTPKPTEKCLRTNRDILSKYNFNSLFTISPASLYFVTTKSSAIVFSTSFSGSVAIFCTVFVLQIVVVKSTISTVSHEMNEGRHLHECYVSLLCCAVHTTRTHRNVHIGTHFHTHLHAIDSVPHQVTHVHLYRIHTHPTV